MLTCTINYLLESNLRLPHLASCICPQRRSVAARPIFARNTVGVNLHGRAEALDGGEADRVGDEAALDHPHWRGKGFAADHRASVDPSIVVDRRRAKRGPWIGRRSRRVNRSGRSRQGGAGRKGLSATASRGEE